LLYVFGLGVFLFPGAGFNSSVPKEKVDEEIDDCGVGPGSFRHDCRREFRAGRGIRENGEREKEEEEENANASNTEIASGSVSVHYADGLPSPAKSKVETAAKVKDS
jgi:hypothetical protein